MRHVYTLLLYLAAPLVFLRLLWRSRKAPAYRQRWPERLGFAPTPPRGEQSTDTAVAALSSPAIRYPQPGCIWVHAVSVGETRAALPLIQALKERYPNTPILVTSTTPTGSAQVRAALQDTVQHVYLPYDLPSAINRFLLQAQPRLGIIMETELWPNLFKACSCASIPLLLANARLSARSASRYRRFGGKLIRQTLDCITVVAAQTRADAVRFNELGVHRERLRISGNIKYDMILPDGLRTRGRALRYKLFGRRKILIGASTHAGEEAMLLDVYSRLRQQHDDLLLVLVPRHPERFPEVAELCRERGRRLAKRSDKRACSPTTEVFLGDSMGELLLFYAAADIAFVGGSLVEKGGHNILEPAALKLPVLFGPHMFNFTEASEQLKRHGAAWQVPDSDSLYEQCNQLLCDESLRVAAGRRGFAAVEGNRGALGRLFEIVESLIEANPPQAAAPPAQSRVGRADSEQPR